MEQTTLGILQASLFGVGSASASNGLVLTVDQPCLVMLRKLVGQLEATVSNPNNATLNVNVDINQELSGEGATWTPASGMAWVRINVRWSRREQVP